MNDLSTFLALRFGLSRIARCMSGGKSTCLTSTADTLMPHGSVCWIQDMLQIPIELFALRQQAIELDLSQHASERGLRQL